MSTFLKRILTIYNYLKQIVRKSRELFSFCLEFASKFFLPKIKIIISAISWFFNRLFSVLSFYEKIILAILLGIIIIAGSLLGWKNYLRKTTAVPAHGGSYTEGILVQKASDIAPVIEKLTKIGLTRFDNEGNLQPDLAEKWEIKNEGKSYIFYLKPFASSSEVADILSTKKEIIQDIKIETPEKNKLILELKQSYAPLLNLVSEPIFPYGPYEIEKESKREIRLKARDDFYQGKPYIEKIILKLYPDQESLIQAFNYKEIDGLAQNSIEINPKGYNIYSMSLPRWLVLFFNLKQEVLNNKEIRQKLINKEKLDKNLDLTLVTLDKEKNVAKAEEIRNQWQELGVNLTIISYDAMILQKEVIPNRDYDLLLYGIDYGRDPDPYPFWHSSQANREGLNLANFENVDADKILEEARQTPDKTKRKELYDRFQKILDEEAPAIFLEQTNWKYIVSKKIKGIRDHPGIIPADRYNEVWKWWIKEKRKRK